MQLPQAISSIILILLAFITFDLIDFWELNRFSKIIGKRKIRVFEGEDDSNEQ